MKHIITLLLIAISATFTGCNAYVNVDSWYDNGRIVMIVKINSAYDIVCDKSTNIAYLLYSSGYHAGITPYLNSDGQPSRCNEVHR